MVKKLRNKAEKGEERKQGGKEDRSLIVITNILIHL